MLTFSAQFTRYKNGNRRLSTAVRIMANSFSAAHDEAQTMVVAMGWADTAGKYSVFEVTDNSAIIDERAGGFLNIWALEDEEDS